MRKLTALSFYYKGRSKTFFVMADIINGKAVVPWNVYNTCLKMMNVSDGSTYTQG